MSKEEPDWYLREWAKLLGKRQADLVNDKGWLKSRVSKFWNGGHSYRREIVNDVADWLGIEPFELLMPPRDAIAMRRLRETARMIVAEESAPYDDPPGATRR